MFVLESISCEWIVKMNLDMMWLTEVCNVTLTELMIIP